MPHLQVAESVIWYDVFGEGPHVVLLIPGAIGTAQSDFYIQLDPSNPSCFDFRRFTFVCVELPGWGRSTPSRQYGPAVLQFDAHCCIALMQHLGYTRYSIVSWSEGAKVALVIVRKCSSDTIRGLVLQGIITYASDIGTKHILWSRNLDNWNQKLLTNYIKAYRGERHRVMHLWDKHMDFIARFGEFYPEGILGPEQDGLSQVDAPTLVLHGDKDFFVELNQSEQVHRYVPNCQLVRFANGAHNLHQTEPHRFKEIVERFLSETGKM